MEGAIFLEWFFSDLKIIVFLSHLMCVFSCFGLWETAVTFTAEAQEGRGGL